MRRLKLSQDPAFAAKLRDVVGPYIDLPAHSLVLSVDEKSKIQARDRTQPGLPMKKGRGRDDDPLLCPAQPQIHALPLADPDRIIEKVNRGYQAMASNHSHVRLSK